MARYSITYENWTPEDLEAGDASERGFVVKDRDLSAPGELSELLREARDTGSWHAPDLPIWERSWFTTSEENPITGAQEVRSLHFEGITLATRVRIARALGAIR